MAQKIKPDPKFPRPETPLPEKRAQRGGGPSMKVPGHGGIKRQTQPQGGRDERSTVHDADAMSHIGGPADVYDRGDE